MSKWTPFVGLAALVALLIASVRKPAKGGTSQAPEGTTPKAPMDPHDPDDDTTDAPAPEPDATQEFGPVDTSKKAKPIAVGPRNDPEIAALITEMRDEFVSQGVDLSVVTPEEVTEMRKAPGRPLAIPPRAYWPMMARTLVEGFMPIRAALGRPINIYNGYRPEDYNEAVGGKPGSRHQWFQAIDMIPMGGGAAARRELALLAAAFYVSRGSELKVGFGTYGDPSSPSGVHIDTGFSRRTWGDAKHFIEQAKGIA